MAQYRFEFLDADRKPIAKCHYQIMQYDSTLRKDVADENGRAAFDSELIAGKKIWVRFWAQGQRQDAAFSTQPFYWAENVITQPIMAPRVYEIKLRETENKNNESEDYRQAFYEVQAGDTWEGIAQKCNTNVSLIKFINNLPDDGTPPEVGDALLLPRGAERPLDSGGRPDKGVIDSQPSDPLDDLLKGLDGKTSEQKKDDQPILPQGAEPVGHGQPAQPAGKNPPPDEGKPAEEKPGIQEGRGRNGKPTDRVIQKQTCCCNRDITTDEFRKITLSSHALSFLDFLNAEFRKFGINTCIEKAYFIAHTLHETGQYTLLEETGVNEQQERIRYGGYKGRGIMQLTWEKNYREYGKAVSGNENTFLNQGKYRISREKVHAVGSGIWFWKYRSLSRHALKNDFITISAIINGGYNGFIEREIFYKKSINAFNVHLCENIDKNIINNINNYKLFENSYVYKNMPAECFGWGLWHDPQTKQRGTNKNAAFAKLGYRRFLEMAENNIHPFGTKGKRYGRTVSQAIAWARKRISEL